MRRLVILSASLGLAVATASPRALAAPEPTPPPAPPPAPLLPPPPPAATSDQSAEIAALRARIDALEASLAHPLTVADVLGTPPPTTTFDASPWSRAWPTGLTISGYVQAQYQQSQLSSDQVSSALSPDNQDRFLVRRARVRVDRGWDFAFATLEVDGNNNSGLAFGLRRAEATLLWRAKDPAAPPLLTLRTGLMDVPFGYELVEPNRARVFLERSMGSRALFPGDTDFGAQLGGAAGILRYAVGAFDGTPLPDNVPSAAGFDFTSEKDFLGRLGVETQPAKAISVAGGVSAISGTGFHEGAAATKASVAWNDGNGNGTIDPGRLTGVPATKATPSSTFHRWGVGADAELRVRTPVGRGILYAEAYIGTNYDRGLFVADPVAAGVDVHEVGWYAAYAQEITRWGLVGLRIDGYNPNTGSAIARGSVVLPGSRTITTFSPIVGLVLPEHARLVFEYDRVLSPLEPTTSGAPTELAEDKWALRLQVSL